MIVDSGWKSFGLASEVSALVSENLLKYLKAPIHRITLPDAPAPASSALERQYYPNCKVIIGSVKKMFKKEK